MVQSGAQRILRRRRSALRPPPAGFGISDLFFFVPPRAAACMRVCKYTQTVHKVSRRPFVKFFPARSSGGRSWSRLSVLALKCLYLRLGLLVCIDESDFEGERSSFSVSSTAAVFCQQPANHRRPTASLSRENLIKTRSARREKATELNRGFTELTGVL